MNKSALIFFFFILKNISYSQTDTSSLICTIDSLSLSHCSCEKLIVTSAKKTESKQILFDGTGTCWTSSLYDKDKRKTQCGFFSKDMKLTYGLYFIYSKDNKLIKIEQYFNSIKIGECLNK